MQTIELSKFRSITAEGQRNGLSEKYCFVPTTKVIDVLAKNGWMPVKASEVHARGERIGFQKHLIRFRKSNQGIIKKDDIFPEIVLFNSHDGSASFQISAGLFRMICSNGLILQKQIWKGRI